MIPRSSYQVLVLDLPRLPPVELEAAARFRVRSLSPLHPDQYRVFLDTLWRPQGVTVLAFLVPGDLPWAPTVASPRAGFPGRLPGHWPRDLVLTRPAGEGLEFYIYRQGVLRSAPPPATTAKAVDETWAAIARDHPGVAVENRVFDNLPARYYPRFRSTLPKDLSWYVAVPVLVLGLAVLAWGATEYGGRLGARNAELQKRVAQLVQVDPTADSQAEKRWQSLRALTGVPLARILEKIATRWPSGVKIGLFEAQEQRLQIEAQAPQALKAIAALVADPWFQDLKVVRIRSVDGGELFLLEGVIHDDL